MDQCRDGHTHRKQLHLPDTSDKAQQHKNHRDAELDAKYCTVTLAKFSVERARERGREREEERGREGEGGGIERERERERDETVILQLTKGNHGRLT